MSTILSFLQNTVLLISGVSSYIILAVGILHVLYMAVICFISIVVNVSNNERFSNEERVKYPLWMIWIYVLSLSSGFIGSIIVKNIVDLNAEEVDILCGQAFLTAYLVIYHVLYNVYLLNYPRAIKTCSKKEQKK